ncbi:50S ribosomal protein L4, bacterial/organelle [Bernardetia litoralis DSM 6794]|uniref:Large ribosomal subunit protein uL4 n=1 Tax=Bernardetia litoralis (strain ATCC 23117 / DSM 6794 / NBRC 15988 / NCIMB 1366 / Fx l1 / Sio-4) TaxID=880071 RepID=I4ANJ8_BERLS|nr:50S ribosomal protein L4 [Bernardetia litoralis]AFM05533.1 50S ribosomal protein L4, bacterial/organelle [Bernardetia litoralis DSM 6794]
MELPILNKEGKEIGKNATLSDAVFAIEPNDHAIYLDVKQYLANQRQGTHASKHRGIVSGSTRKIKRQKGTGGARAGSIKSPVFVGGGRVFGPEPRDYSFKLNRKVKQLARKSALSHKAKAEAITVMENLVMDAPKTKEFIALLNNLNLSGKKVLVVTGEQNDIVYRSARNLPKTKVLPANQLHTYHIMNSDVIVLAEGALEVIQAEAN